MAGRHRLPRHRRSWPRPARAAAAAAAVAIAAVCTPVVLLATAPDPAPAPSPPSSVDAAEPLPVPPRPGAATTTAPAAPEAAASCADFDTAAAAAAALQADPELAEVLDTDGDGRPCELRFVPAPAPQTTPQFPAAAADGACPSSGFDGVEPHVARAGHHLAGLFDVPLLSVLGVGARTNTSYHPSGRALDFMVDRVTGDALAAHVLDRMDELGVIEVIWRQRINFGSGWEPMEDRGGITANHYDHVHLSFATTGPARLSC